MTTPLTKAEGVNAATLINQTSGSVEYYTPIEIIEAARKTMGRIGLDPASSLSANVRVGADAWFGPYDNSLGRAWCDEVWMNHPFGRPEKACAPDCIKEHVHHDFDYHGNAAWINKLEHEFAAGSIVEACCITFACTSEKWFQPLLRRPQCFLVPRTNYLLPDGSTLRGVTKGSAVTYYGHDTRKFMNNFRHLGIVKEQCR